MKTKITLFFTLILFFFLGSAAFAQTVSGVASNTGCPNGGIITASSTRQQRCLLKNVQKTV